MANPECKVRESMAKDVGRGIIRIDPQIAKELDLSAGQAIQIIGKRRTAALYWPAYPQDRGTRVARLDGSTRRNAGVGIDDTIEIVPIEPKLATKVEFAPVQNIRIQGVERYLKHILMDRVLTKGDYIEIPIYNQRIVLIVSKISPNSDAVIMQEKSNIIMSQRPTKDVQQDVFSKIRYEDIGGLSDEIQKVREMIELPGVYCYMALLEQEKHCLQKL
jgi:transitional endoplasmic reticulum ATPase